MTIKKKKLGFWEEIKWTLFMIKIRLLLYINHLKKKIIRATLCKKGFHKINHNNVEISKSMKSKE